MDLNNIWLFSEAVVSKKFTFGDFTDCFKKGSNNCNEAFVSAFKPLYFQNMCFWVKSRDLTYLPLFS